MEVHSENTVQNMPVWVWGCARDNKTGPESRGNFLLRQRLSHVPSSFCGQADVTFSTSFRHPPNELTSHRQSPDAGPLVESRGGGAGHHACAPDRADEERHDPTIHRQGPVSYIVKPVTHAFSALLKWRIRRSCIRVSVSALE